MKQSSKILLIIAGILVFFGGTLAVISGGLRGDGFMVIESEAKSISEKAASAAGSINREYTELTRTELAAFDTLEIDLAFGDIIIEAGSGYYMEYCLDATFYDYTHSIANDTFTFTGKSNLSNSGFFFTADPFPQDTYLKITIPQETQLDKISVKASSGDVKLKDLSGNSVVLQASYGDGEIENLSGRECIITAASGNLTINESVWQSIDITDNYGNIKLANTSGDNLKILANSGNIDIENGDFTAFALTSSYGNVTLKNIELLSAEADMSLKLSSGNLTMKQVKGNGLSIINHYGKLTGQGLEFQRMTADMSSGNCSISESDIETIKIKNSYGDVELELPGSKESWGYDLKTAYGSIYLDKENLESKYQQNGQTARKAEINCSSGNIKITTGGN